MEPPEPPSPSSLFVLQTPHHAVIRCSELLKPSFVSPDRLRWRASILPEREWTLWPKDWQTLQTTAAAGCSECALIVGIVNLITENVATIQSITLGINKDCLSVKVWESKTADEQSGAKALWGVPVFWPRSAQPTPWPTIPMETARTTNPKPPSFASSVPQLRQWIEKCDNGHNCLGSHDLPALPTRVIDVGDADTSPRLYLSKQGERGRYAALSHCWGPPGTKRLTTTSKNLSSHCDQIPLDSFPLSFQDAINVTRALGLRYLWIDCLCILQDSPPDWAQESSRMADLYTDAYISLAADFAPDSTAGLFVRKDTMGPQLRQFTQQDSDGNVYDILVRQETPAAVLDHSDTASTQACYREEARSSLQRRGWILQEESLSRRIVRFTNAELIWECRERRVCSCEREYPRTPQTAKGLVDRMLRDSNPVTTSNKDTWPWHCWYYLVEEFTKRKLTYVEDRLPGFSGIAAVFGLPASEYLAGLWRHNLDNLLLWENLAGRIKVETPGLNNSHGSHHQYRIQGPYAPSWSWASVSGTISYPSIFGTFDRDDGDSKSADWTILEATATPLTRNPYGPVDRAFLRVEGRLLPVEIGLCESPDYRGERRLAGKQVMSTCIYPRGPQTAGTKGQVLLASMDAGIAAREWDDCGNYEYFFLLAGFHVMGSRGNLWEAPVGLILRRLKDTSNAAFSRIGFCMMYSSLLEIDWTLVERSIVVIV
ncbi:heterokaryon incompatibility protein-domain-containing protein [Cladorrhinum sp. PSN259]|nr:heterokaryon incompatibility protein-domain-containing protein [Cladorrhinum sp. PSN259]